MQTMFSNVVIVSDFTRCITDFFLIFLQLVIFNIKVSLILCSLWNLNCRPGLEFIVHIISQMSHINYIHWLLPDPVFEAGKTYVYKYEALLLAGLLEKGSARAGLNISSKVSINAIDQNTYFIKVKIKILHKLQSFTFYMYTNWIKPYSYMKAWGTWAPGV